MNRLLAFMFISLFAALPLASRTLPKLKRESRREPVEVFDTLRAPRADAVRFSGYEKTNPSNRETFFASNCLGADSTIVAFEVEITYFDAGGKQLHQRTEMIRCLLPAGETRAVSLATWDSNHAFHYYQSTPPRSRRSSPFSVASRLCKVVITKE